MSAPIDNGGPAFPHEGGDFSGLMAHPGMTLRDWFAGQAMAGILVETKASSEERIPGMLRMCAQFSYAAADAMLAARNKQEGSK